MDTERHKKKNEERRFRSLAAINHGLHSPTTTLQNQQSEQLLREIYSFGRLLDGKGALLHEYRIVTHIIPQYSSLPSA